jgi:hypothetical protein
VRPGIVVKKKDVFHVSVRKNSTDALSQFFKVSLYCAPKSRQGILQHWYTASFSKLAEKC